MATHFTMSHVVSSSVGWKWEVGNGKCLQLGLLVGKNMHVYTCMILPFPMGESVAFFDIPGPMVPG